jgi:hypothetical protein
MEESKVIYESIDNFTFSTSSEVENRIILHNRWNSLINIFNKRLLLTGLISIIVIILETIGLKNQGKLDQADEMSLYVLLFFVIINLLSILNIYLKVKLITFSNSHEYIYGDIYEISKNSPFYVLFEKENKRCTTAINIKNIEVYNSLKMGEKILILRDVTSGVPKYEVFKTI